MWALAIGLSVLWLVFVVTLVLVALRGELSGELILGAIVQLIAPGYGAPALWFCWRRLLERRAADGPRPPEVGGPGGTSRCTGRCRRLRGGDGGVRAVAEPADASPTHATSSR